MPDIGSFGVIIPDIGHRKLYFLNDDQVEMADRLFNKMKELAESHYQTVATLDALPDTSQDDQAIVGGLCAALVEFARFGEDSALHGCAFAISRIIGVNYFIVEGEIDATGTTTKIHKLTDATCDDDVTTELLRIRLAAVTRSFFGLS